MELEKLVSKLRSLASIYEFTGNTKTNEYQLAVESASAIELLSSAIPHICECCVGCEVEKPGGSCPHGFIPSAKRIQEYIAGMKKKYDEVLKAAKQMHLWIFLNSIDTQKAYDECHLSEEMNRMLGYMGDITYRLDDGEEKNEQ